MKRFWLSVALCFTLLLIGLFSFMPATEAQNNVLANLLNLPAPPPPNPLFHPTNLERDENFYNKEKPLSDDAPINDLLDYWTFQSNSSQSLGYNPKPSAKALARILEAVEKEPEKLPGLLNALDENRDAAETVKRLYDVEVSAQKFERNWRDAVRGWLTTNSKYFSSDLVPKAQAVTDTGEYVSNQDELLALSRVDWEKARPIVERLYSDGSKPVSQVLAKWALYKHALEEDSFADADRYRDELKQVVENKSATDGMRDLALDALVKEKSWEGRDDWYYSLLEDETLADLRVNGQSYTGLTTLIYYSPADKHLDKMIELLKSSNPTVRSAVLRNLSLLIDRAKNPELLKALLPWLEDPRWARETNGERRKIVTALRNYVIPESVPGLIAVLNEKEKREIPNYPNANSNMSRIYEGNVMANRSYNTNSAVRKVEVEVYPLRSEAITALAMQKNPSAAAPLRQVLPQVEGWERSNVVRAILASDGFTVAEQIEALEDYAEKTNSPEQMMTSNSNAAMNTSLYAPQIVRDSIAMTTNSPVGNTMSYRQQFDPNEVKFLLGSSLTSLENPSDELVKAVIERINFHEKRNPQIAFRLRSIIQNWKGTAINALLLRDLKNGKSNIDAIVKLLVFRKELREKQISDVTDIRGGGAVALGISACLLEESTDYDALLDGENLEAKAAMLACARLIRAALPVQKVAVLLKNPNKPLALAAERYLESEDSAEARQAVLAQHPNEARILGARFGFMPENISPDAASINYIPALFASVNGFFRTVSPYYYYEVGTSDGTEKNLQKEVKEDQNLLGIYAYDDNFVRFYKDKAVFSWQDDPARYRERVLTAEEYQSLTNFLGSQRAEDFAPFLSICDQCESKELLMLGRAGGRRVFVKAEPLPKFFEDLGSIFNEFRRTPGQIHYYLEKDVPGLEVLYTDDDHKAETVWKNGADFRLLLDDQIVRKQREREEEKRTESEENVDDTEVSDEETDANVETEKPLTPAQKAAAMKKRREEMKIARQKEYSSYNWFKFERGKSLEPIAQPAAVEFIPLTDNFAVQTGEQQWKARAANVEIRADEDGLYKISGGQIAKIRDGNFMHPFITPNGRWAIAGTYGEESEKAVRINLLTNKEFKIEIAEEYSSKEALAFLPALNKVLMFSGYYGDGEDSGEYRSDEREGELYLLDVETGVVQPFKGEARPLLQQTFRPLQTVAASPESFWTALPDRANNVTQFGIYSTKTFTFKPLLTIPQIIFSSMDMWVDEPEGKIYFVYEGHLLALPLPKAQK